MSGDTRGAVEYASLYDAMEYKTLLYDEFSISDNYNSHNTSKAESLLLDIEFYKKNVLKQLAAKGSADVVNLNEVIYAEQAGALMPDETELNVRLLHDEYPYKASPGSVFLSDPTARLLTSSLSLIVAEGDGGNTIQLDVASINSTDKEFWVYAQSSSNVTIFASDFVSSIFMTNTTSDNTPPRKPLCVATKDDVNLTAATILINSEKYTVIPGGTTCN